MARQFAPRLEGQGTSGQRRQAFAGSRSGAVRNAAPVRTREAASPARVQQAASGLSPSMTGHVADEGNDTLTLGATPVDEATLRIWLNGVLMDPWDWGLDGRVVSLDPLTAGDVLVDQYWTKRKDPPHSVLSGAAITLLGQVTLTSNSWASTAKVGSERVAVFQLTSSGDDYCLSLVSTTPAVLDDYTWSPAGSGAHNYPTTSEPLTLAAFGEGTVLALTNDYSTDSGFHQIGTTATLHRFDFTGDTVPTPTTAVLEASSGVTSGFFGGQLIFPDWSLLPLSDSAALLMRLQRVPLDIPDPLPPDYYPIDAIDRYTFYHLDVASMTVSGALHTLDRLGTVVGSGTYHFPYGAWLWQSLGDGSGIFSYDAGVNGPTPTHDDTMVHVSADSSSLSWSEVSSSYDLWEAMATPGVVQTAGSAWVFIDNGTPPTAQQVSVSGGALVFSGPTITRRTSAFWGAPGAGTLVVTDVGPCSMELYHGRLYIAQPGSYDNLVTTAGWEPRSSWVGLPSHIIGVDKDGEVYSVSIS